MRRGGRGLISRGVVMIVGLESGDAYPFRRGLPGR